MPCAASFQTRWASSSEKGKGVKRQEGSFKGQMLESITERIAREKLELANAAAERQATGAGRNFAITMSAEPRQLP